MSESKIEWTDTTWNPWIGCAPVSPGCDNCYARREEDTRFRHLGRCPAGFWAGPVYQGDDVLWRPLHWRKPRRVFVGSRTDLFHEDIRFDAIDRVFRVMEQCPQHTFQVLTKRPERMEYYLQAVKPSFMYLPNVWLGVTVEDQERDDRIGQLMGCKAAVRFVSAEPLLGPLDLDCRAYDCRAYDEPQLDWVIVGGESGKNARPMDADWVREIRDECSDSGVPFFFKQWGEYDADGVRVGKRKAGRMLDGRTWNEMPTVAAAKGKGER